MPQWRKGELRIRCGLEEDDQEDQNTCYFQRFVKLLTTQGSWRRRLVSRRGSSNILSVVFMHFRMRSHAQISGVNWGCKEISVHCWWCIIPEPLHIKGKSPCWSPSSVLLRWSIFTCLNCWMCVSGTKPTLDKEGLTPKADIITKIKQNYETTKMAQ